MTQLGWSDLSRVSDPSQEEPGPGLKGEEGGQLQKAEPKYRA